MTNGRWRQPAAFQSQPRWSELAAPANVRKKLKVKLKSHNISNNFVCSLCIGHLLYSCKLESGRSLVQVIGYIRNRSSVGHST